MNRSLGLGAVGAVMAAAIILVAGHLPRGRELPTSTSGPAAQSSSHRPEGLLYLHGTHLMRRSLRAHRPHEIVDLGTQDVVASPSSPWIAYVVPQQGSANGPDTDFVARPELHLRDLESGADQRLGLGFGPHWDQTGSRLAYLSPAGARRCDGENCSGMVRVMVGAPGVAPKPITGPGHFRLLAWSGARLLLSADPGFSGIISVPLVGSSPVTLPLPPRQFWDASPDGRWLLAATPGGHRFIRLRGGRPMGTGLRSDLTPAGLGDGSWSPRSGMAAAVLRGPGRVHLALLSPGRRPMVVPHSQGAMGNVVWDSRGARFAFEAVDSRDDTRLQAVICRLRSRRKVSCKRWFSWRQDVALLGFAFS